MELAQALQFSYTSVAQEIVCDTDAMARLCGTLDRLRAKTAVIVTAGMTPHAAGLAAADAVAQFCQQLGLPSRLRDVDVPPEGLEAIAAATLYDRAPGHEPDAHC